MKLLPSKIQARITYHRAICSAKSHAALDYTTRLKCNFDQQSTATYILTCNACGTEIVTYHEALEIGGNAFKNATAIYSLPEMESPNFPASPTVTQDYLPKAPDMTPAIWKQVKRESDEILASFRKSCGCCNTKRTK